jgi:sugar O-acyltransferase (sialic acid O-acetyltransferase NeuD family)
MKRLALLGASGHGKVIADIAESLGYGEVIFFDDDWPNKKNLDKWKIVGTTEDIINQAAYFDDFFVSIGANSIRVRKHNLLKNIVPSLPVLIHPSAIVSPYATLSSGTVIMPGAIINAGAHIAEACIINTGATVDHDCIVGTGTHISPGANLAGKVMTGNEVWIGIGASVKQCLSIGDSTVIGAGATVINDIPAEKTATGCPARYEN